MLTQQENNFTPLGGNYVNIAPGTKDNSKLYKFEYKILVKQGEYLQINYPERCSPDRLEEEIRTFTALMLEGKILSFSVECLKPEINALH